MILVDSGSRKIQVIEAIRDLTDLGLKEAKDIIDSPPQVVAQGLDRTTAHRFRATLELEGATIEVREATG